MLWLGPVSSGGEASRLTAGFGVLGRGPSGGAVVARRLQPARSDRISSHRRRRRSAGYTPEGQPAATASADVAGGAAQKFDMGRDIPGEWWKVFHSKELDSLMAEALQANPSLQAAQAALWQAKENLYAQTGKLLPSIDANASATRQQFSPAEFGGGGAPSIFNLFQATVNVSYAPDVFGGQRRQIEVDRGAGRVSAFRA